MSTTEDNVVTDQLLIECSKPDPDVKVIEDLCKSGVDSSLNDSGYTPLMLHLARSTVPDPNIITTLVKAGVHIQRTNPDNDGMTALLYACENKNSSLEVFQTLFKLGANHEDERIGDEVETPFLELYISTMGGQEKMSEEPQKSIFEYFQHIKATNNAENTSINGVYLHKALEEYIKSTNNHDPAEISKIIKSYSHIAGIYPSNVDVTNTVSDYYATKTISNLFYSTIEVLFVAASHRCSIEVFQTLLFEYAFSMAERFEVNLKSVLAGNYEKNKNDTPVKYDMDDDEYKVIYRKLYTKDILNLYIKPKRVKDDPISNTSSNTTGTSTTANANANANTVFPHVVDETGDGDAIGETDEMNDDIILSQPTEPEPVKDIVKDDDDDESNDESEGDKDDDDDQEDKNGAELVAKDYNLPPFDIETFKYLTTMVNLKFGRLHNKTYDPERRYDALHPLIRFLQSENDLDNDQFLEILNIFTNCDTKINISDNHGSNLIMTYIRYQYDRGLDIRVLERLIELKININYRNIIADGITPLMVAAASNYPLSDLKKLIKLGARVNVKDEYGSSAATHHLQNFQSPRYNFERTTEILRFLLPKISVEQPRYSHDDNLLLYSHHPRHDMKVFEQILKTSIYPNGDGDFNYNCVGLYLMHALEPSFEVLHLMVYCRVNIKERYWFMDRTPLLLAALHGCNHLILHTMISLGAKAGDVDERGHNLFNHLCEGRSLSSYDMIEADGSSVRVYSRNTKKSYDDTFKYVISLFKKGKKTATSLAYKGDELLLYCELDPCLDNVKLLLKSDSVKVNLTDDDGNNALMLLLKNTHNPDPKIITALVQANLDINYKNKQDNDRTALFYACDLRLSLDVIKTLVDNGADVKNIDDNQTTPLSCYVDQPYHYRDVDDKTVSYLRNMNSCTPCNML